MTTVTVSAESVTATDCAEQVADLKAKIQHLEQEV